MARVCRDSVALRAGALFGGTKMSIHPNSAFGSYVGSSSPTITTTGGIDRARLTPALVRPTVSPVPSGKRVLPMNRKRRTVLWLYNEDCEYLSAVAEQDMDSKNVSMHRLVKALRAAGIKSFLKLDESIKRLPPPAGRA